MTVPTFMQPLGLGRTSNQQMTPYVQIVLHMSPEIVIEADSGGGGSPPTSGQLWPRRA